ncbi:tetratricopeptide repeat protein [Tamlana flava]|uniref:tetratricopeptide repeat protein n=1 Tax=Tamlana flava TaxID=3158572 RepID=UPI00351AF3ED
MRPLFIIFFFVGAMAFSQGDILAKEYFKNGEYEKALMEYKKLYAKSPSNPNYINQIIRTYQELEQYDEAEVFLTQLMERMKYPPFWVELGYNYQLKNNMEKARELYDAAIKSIDERASNVFSVARSFQNHSLLDEAVLAYEKAMVLNPDYNFNVQLAQIYGEQGNIEKMFNSYLDFAESNPIVLSDVKRAINDFISEDGLDENNVLFRKILLKKMQEEPDVLWNELLSWLFIQQKDFRKAFIQEKAIYNRMQEGLQRVEELASICVNENESEIAKEVYGYIIETAQNPDTELNAHYNLLLLEIKESSKADYATIEAKYVDLLKTFGAEAETLNLQISYAHFLAFYIKETKRASVYLENLLENEPLNQLEQAQIKLELGDILVLQEQFNKALIYYTQIQRNLKNSTISQEARFKVAKASYYKGDFKWAESQLKILKSSTSQLIANDALELKLLITDNKYEDSLQTALKQYAKADLLAFQNRNDEAIILLDKILEEHKTEPIIAQTLFKQAQLFVLKKEFEKAKANYEVLIENYRDGILVDDALFNLAQIYENQLNQMEKAKSLYENIIFNHADSIYFVDARKRFRALRGDAIN